jgi:heptose I phosphotransferase
MILELRDDFHKAWPQPFDAVQQVDGEVYRDKEGRTTQRFVFAGEPYFLKVHRGVGWGEIIKNLVQLRLPVIGAENEWRAIEFLHRLGVGTMTCVGYGKRGLNPARQLSFLLTEELRDMVSLEDYCAPWAEQAPDTHEKRLLLNGVASIAATMHNAGMNHRDFYLCHFLMPENWDQTSAPQLHLIDLHRAEIRGQTPQRWRVKDLGALYFSAADIGLSRRDVLRFLRIYTGLPLREALADQTFWSQVCRRALKLYERDFGVTPRLPLS